MVTDGNMTSVIHKQNKLINNLLERRSSFTYGNKTSCTTRSTDNTLKISSQSFLVQTNSKSNLLIFTIRILEHKQLDGYDYIMNETIGSYFRAIIELLSMLMPA